MSTAHAGMAGDEAGARGHGISSVILCVAGASLHKHQDLSDVACFALFACSAVISCLSGVFFSLWDCFLARRGELSGLRRSCVQAV